MKDARPSSTTRNTAEKVRDDHDGVKFRSQNNTVNLTDSPSGSAPRSKAEPFQKTRVASPRREELGMERRSGPEFEQGVRRYDSQIPTYFADQRDGGDYDYKRGRLATHGDRIRSLEKEKLNEKQESPQYGELNNGAEFDREVQGYGSQRTASYVDQRDVREFNDTRSRSEAHDEREQCAARQRLNEKQANCSPSQEIPQHGDVNSNMTTSLEAVEDHRNSADHQRQKERQNKYYSSQARFENCDVNNKNPSSLEAAKCRRSSAERQQHNERQARNSSSRERPQHDDVKNELRSRRYYDDHRNRAVNRKFDSEAIPRPKSLGRYSGNFPNNDRDEQDYYGGRRSVRDFSGSREFLARETDADERRSGRLGQDQHAREKLKKSGQFPDNLSSDEQRRLYQDQSHIRRSQSAGRYEDDRTGFELSERSYFEEPQHELYHYDLPRSVSRHDRPFFESGNGYFGIRRNHEADGYSYLRNGCSPLRTDQFEFDRFGFNTFGVNKFGYDRYGNCFIF